MRFGCCVGPDQIAILVNAGYDFCELPARAVLPHETDTAALPAMRAIEAAGLRPESFNSLVPPEVPMVGPHASASNLRKYLRRTFGRMVSLGAKVVVLGSGGARRIPDDIARAVALNQLAESLEIAAEEAGRAGIELALEHLNSAECNVFTTIAESQDFIQARGIAGMRLLADLHHLEMEHEPLESVVRAAPLLVHVHVADGGRRAPGVGGYNYAGFMAALQQVGYDARISAECSWENLEEQAGSALEFMRAQWNAASAV